MATFVFKLCPPPVPEERFYVKEIYHKDLNAYTEAVKRKIPGIGVYDVFVEEVTWFYARAFVQSYFNLEPSQFCLELWQEPNGADKGIPVGCFLLPVKLEVKKPKRKKAA